MWRGTVSVVSVGSSLTDGGLSHGESCIVKTKTIFMSNDPYDQCDVTMNGDHAKIDAWRREASLARTLELRPDLLQHCDLSSADQKILAKLKGAKK